MMQPNNNDETNFDQQLVPVDTMNNNADGDSNYYGDVGANFNQLVLVDTMDNIAAGDNNYNDGGTNFSQQLVPVNMMNNNGETNFDQQVVPVDTMNNNANGDNSYNNNGGASFNQQLIPVEMVNNNANGDNSYNHNGGPSFNQQLVNNNANVDNSYNHNGGASSSQQLIPVDIVNNNANGVNSYNTNGGASSSQQLIPVDIVNNNANGDNSYNHNGGASSSQQLIPVDIVNNNANGDNNYNINNGVINFGEEDFDGANATENQDGGGSGNEANPSRKRKRYHRHNHLQIQEMEAFFKECPHPDDKQRKELSRQVGLGPLQIKFWFQNKRTQNKNLQERQENAQLRTDNDRLKAENMKYQEDFCNAICPNCHGQQTAIREMCPEEHNLRNENAKLLEEIGHLTLLAEKWAGYPVRMGATGREMAVYGNGDDLWKSIPGPAEADKQIIIELAVRAMEELMRMVQVGEPLWMVGINGTGLVLNFDEYRNTFGRLGPRSNNGVRSEASRDSVMVPMSHMGIVKMLMDVNQWSMMFGGVINKAMTHEVLLTGGAGNLDGSVQLMSAEFKVLSPLVSMRENYFVRYCKQHGDGLWAVVDVSIDHFIPNLELKCRKRPSGCLIQESPNGCSKVTWIEHVEVDDRVVHYMYRHLLNTGQAFGASRWLAALDRQCERLACIMAPNFPSIESDGLIGLPDQAKSEMLKLAERMVRSFLAGVTTSSEQVRRMIAGGVGDDISVMTSTGLSGPGRPPGQVLCAATSFWLPVPPQILFDFLRDDNYRTKWDVLCSGGTVHKISEIANGKDRKHSVTVHRGLNSSQNDMMIIQESSTSATGSLVIYAPLDVAAIESVFRGAESDYLALLPAGFVILPDGTAHLGGRGGSLLTASFQMLVDAPSSSSSSSSGLTYSSVATIENLVRATMHRIKNLFPCRSA